MHTNVLRVASALLVSLACLNADQVTLTNGDRVSGKIVKKDKDTLSVKTDLMGEVTVKWKDVAGVSTD